MPLVIAIISGKGGTGKTTVAANLGTALVERGHRVLVVDAADPQGGLAAHLGVKLAPGEPTLSELLRGQAAATDADVIREAHGIDVISGSAALADVEIALAGGLQRGQGRIGGWAGIATSERSCWPHHYRAHRFPH